MYLKRLLLNTKYKSIPAGFELKVSKKRGNSKLIEPLCFVGGNGSGKSNVLEVLSEIFYHLDLHALDDFENKESISPDDFELEYTLPYTLSTQQLIGDLGLNINAVKKEESGESFSVFIKKQPKSKSFQYQVKFEYEYLTVPIKYSRSYKLLLPQKVIAYTSGDNETLSQVYRKMEFNYFKQLDLQLKEKILTELDTSRLLYMDNDLNSAIFISNYLFHSESKLDELYSPNKIGVCKLDSFRIQINLKDYRNEIINLSNTFNAQVESLKKCATTYFEEKDKGENTIKYIFDYVVTEATEKLFKHYFQSSKTLFKFFYQLHNLNIHRIPVRQRPKDIETGKNPDFWTDLPKAGSKDKVFQIKNVMLQKQLSSGKKIRMNYRNLSDGEHQFMHVVGTVLMMNEKGTLFLFDEPGTHFNPQWRSEFVQSVNTVITEEDKEKKEEVIRQQEFILTTHSPFVISDCRKHNVFVFDRDHIKEFKQPKSVDIQTYGASPEELMEEIFHREITISEFSYSGLKKLSELVAKADDEKDLKSIEAQLRNYGDSPEKFLLKAQIFDRRQMLPKN